MNKLFPNIVVKIKLLQARFKNKKKQTRDDGCCHVPLSCLRPFLAAPRQFIMQEFRSRQSPSVCVADHGALGLE